MQSRRFAATLGELTGGRVGLTCGSVGVLKGAVTIAIRYSAGRQQFGPPDSPEVRFCGVLAGSKSGVQAKMI
jgi:acyl-CoA oxidase